MSGADDLADQIAAASGQIAEKMGIDLEHPDYDTIVFWIGSEYVDPRLVFPYDVIDEVVNESPPALVDLANGDRLPESIKKDFE
jgi:hypothetical protein